MKAAQSERRRRRRERRRARQEAAYYAALEVVDSAVRAVYPRPEPKPITGTVCYAGNPTGSPDPRKISVQRAKHKVRMPRQVKLAKHRVVVERVAKVGKVTIEGASKGESLGNPWEYQHHELPTVTDIEVLETVKRAGYGRAGKNRMPRAKLMKVAMELGWPGYHCLYGATEIIGKHKNRTYKEKSDRVVVRNPNRDVNKHTITPESADLMIGARSLDNTGWTLLKIQYSRRDRTAYAILAKLDDRGKRVRKPVTVTRVKSVDAAIENICKVYDARVA